MDPRPPLLPAYDELPVRPGAPAGSAAGVSEGQVFTLNLELELPDPPLYGRRAFGHTVIDRATGHDDELDGWNTQSSSQWDGFRHVRNMAHGFYNGVADEDHGVAHWARRGIVGRAVLADVARWREAAGRPLRPDATEPVTVDDLAGTLEAQGTEVAVGDV